ncbi:FAD/NAD(P)-binding domain-containing protein [Aspergillus sclerotiicarbonarius CBS 121057]|uniref:FAD/NAD(P)-binding domain-containing protein n=1 Tax=Aspergillus sclerotiicarbonarius (strain CBS 121057 / IBT 28362) TaxID=1448318 RepID=A0A319EF07_ASPSB|nr:FAD/NAD(P)-binding domain-containing protein [Aspergillus sclerotiicarbonarius CBS 121057]
MDPPKSNFRVVIVGGSVAGLTLAHCLLRNSIDFVVLEARDEIAPQEGASLGIHANGARILDQLGLFDDILDSVEPLQRSFVWSDAGKLISATDTPKILHERHGYPPLFLDRQTVLEILYKHLGDLQDRVLISKKVTSVKQSPEKVLVHCEDNSVFEGDIVVGADGVRSTVRQHMWDYMEAQGFTTEVSKERANTMMTSEYSCVFGISTPTPGLIPGTVHRTYGEGYSFVTVSSKDNRIYWFFFHKMDQTYTASQIPRFNQAEMDKHVAAYLHKPVTGSVPFSEVYKRSVSKALLAMEEALYTHWSVDRWVCIGDSSHKMTANMGQGGNSAIESATSLANSLAGLIQRCPEKNPTVQDIHTCLKAWETERQLRMKGIWRSAYDLARLEALATWKHKLIAIYIMPYITKYLVNRTSAVIVEAVQLDCEPLPPKSLQCTMPYKSHDNYAQPGTDQTWKRALLTAPLVGCYAAAKVTMETVITKLWPFAVPLLTQGVWTARNGETLSLTRPLYHIPFLDNMLRPLITCFLPSISGSDPRSHIQILSFMADLGPVYGIWLLESYRKAHSWHQILLPVAAGIAFQRKGIGKLAPIYYAAEYIQTPLSRLLSGNNCEVEPATSGSLIISMLAGYYLPTLANFFAPTLESRQQYNALWQLFPVVIPLLQGPLYVVAKRCFSDNPTQPKQGRKKSMRCMRCIRYAYGTFALVSGLTFIYARFSAPPGASITSIFWPGLQGYLAPVTSFSEGIARFLQYDQVISAASGFVWLALRFRELKQSGASFSWTKAIGAMVACTCAFGPGATFALGWGWREEILHRMSGR